MSLTVVGTGIKSISHLTIEVQAHIVHADKVLYLVNEPAMMEWIKSANATTESLEPIYYRYSARQDSYQAITHYILDSLIENKNVCVVIYGHPCIFAQPAMDAVIIAREKGYSAQIFPAISAEDCLFADLCIDPGAVGAQSFEATDFLIYQRKFDNSSHLILWQVGVMGVLGHPENHNNAKNALVLSEYLSDFYPRQHKIILYQAAQYPHFEPTITTLMLAELQEADFSELSTLYIPPAYKKKYDVAMLEKLTAEN